MGIFMGYVSFREGRPFGLEGVPQAYAITIVVSHLLTGMIL